MPASDTANEIAGVRSAPAEPSSGRTSPSTGGVVSTTSKPHCCGAIALP